MRLQMNNNFNFTTIPQTAFPNLITNLHLQFNYVAIHTWFFYTRFCDILNVM